jgi:hypothetical protein
MNQDIKGLLRQVTPGKLPPELRQRVLAAVEEELSATCPAALQSRRTHPRRGTYAGLAVAASLLASLFLNHVVNTTVERRLAAVLGPQPIPRQAAEIASEIALLTDSRTGKWAFERLAAGRGRDDDAPIYPLRLRTMIHQLLADFQETSDESTQEDLQMDRNRRGSRDRHPPGAERSFRLEHWNTA